MQPNTTPVSVSPAIQRLDDRLNHALLTAASEPEARAVWDFKVSAKRILQRVPFEDLDRMAAELLDAAFQDGGGRAALKPEDHSSAIRGPRA